MRIIKYFFYILSFILVSIFGYMKFNNYNLNDIGLTVLSWIKKAKGESVNLSILDNKETIKMSHERWSELLTKHVTESGKVNYEGFIKDQIQFEEYLSQLSQSPPGTNWSDEEKIAYWINAYNAFTVKLIIDHYPLKSIKNISDGLPMINSPWDIKFFKIGKTDFDLNTIEHEILRKQFDEPRIHFAINCASFSCPVLRNEAFTADRLNEQLEDQATSFINNPDKNSINSSETKLSKIFSWFESDFTKKESLIDFIKKYAPTINQENKIEHLEYLWNLNE